MGNSGGARVQYIELLPEPNSPMREGKLRQYPNMLPGTTKGTCGKCDEKYTNKPLALQNALQCKVGGLVTGRCNEVRESPTLMETQ